MQYRQETYACCVSVFETKSTCDHKSPDCCRNYKENKSLSSSEGTNTVANVQRINGHVRVNNGITDVNRRVQKALWEHSAHAIKHHLCMVHRFRTFRKRIKSHRLVSSLHGISNEAFSKRVATFTRQRLYMQKLSSTSIANRIIQMWWMGCLTSQSTIFQSYMWQHIDVQADWKFDLRSSSRWIGCLTSQLTIFQSYMWRHIHVQADWRRSSWTYGRAPNAITSVSPAFRKRRLKGRRYIAIVAEMSMALG